MNAKATPAQKFQIIPVKQLKIAPDNIRKTPATKTEDQQLKASIRNTGVILPLIVKAGGKGQYLVYAGGRRLEQTQLLIKEKAFPAAHGLACLVVPDEANATEISIIENTLQAKMHPVDQYEAFHKLHHVEGLSVKEIGLHFGRSENNIKQILALGGAHPELRELCRAGKLEVSALEAYAITDDQAKQLQAFEALKKRGQGYASSEHYIRQLLTENTFNTDHKFVKFIGLKNYRARNGETTTDLFGGRTILHNAALVETMLREKLDEVTASLQAEGWKWVQTDLEYHSKHNDGFGHQKPTIELTATQQKERAKLEKQLAGLDAEKSKLEATQRREETADSEAYEKAEARIEQIDEEWNEIEDKIEAIDAAAATFSDRQKAAGGCIVTLTFEGKLDVIRGLTKKDEQAKKGKSTTASKAATLDGDSDEDFTDADDKDDAGDGPDPDSLYPQSVYDDLACYHLAAAQAELLYNHELMYKVAQFAVCWQILGSPSQPHTLNLSLRPSESIESSKKDITDSRMHQELLEFRDKLNLTWLRDTEVESFRAFQRVDHDDVVNLAGYCMTVSLQKITLNPRYSSDTLLDELLTQAGAKLAKHWRPTADNFFSRLNNDQRHDIAHALYAPTEPPPATKKMKRAEFSTWLQDRVAEYPPAKCWLPPNFTYTYPSGEEEMLEQLKKEAGQ